MKKFLLALFIITISFSQTAEAKWGVGLILGEPTGITLKNKMGANDLIFNVGSSGFGEVRIDGLYTFNFPNAFNSNKFELYLAVGAALGIGNGDGVFEGKKNGNGRFYRDDDGIGIAALGAVGVNFYPARDWEIFLQLGPIISLVPDVGGGFDGGLGFRYYFK